MQRWTIALIIILATLGPSLVIAMVGSSSIKALSRNPSAAPKIQMAMILAFIFAAAIAVLALLILFHVFTNPVPAPR
jgi:F0F1-type ATP synthase membrane subunit c/vacuolar-type H+-ATPase subunit K